jgi:LPXTG-site transpeptidase (sortase) family protein
MKWFSVLLMIFGLLWVSLGNYYFWNKDRSENLSFDSYPVKSISIETGVQPQENKSLPVQITISDLNIDLPIIPAKIENQIWETTHAGVSYLVSSPIPGKTGNSIVYGHNWTKLFGNLVNAKSGQDIEISYADGSQKRFIIKSTSIVDPTDSSVLTESNDQKITLYTCTGFLDSKRFVVAAYLDKNPSFADVRKW